MNVFIFFVHCWLSFVWGSHHKTIVVMSFTYKAPQLSMQGNNDVLYAFVTLIFGCAGSLK